MPVDTSAWRSVVFSRLAQPFMGRKIVLRVSVGFAMLAAASLACTAAVAHTPAAQAPAPINPAAADVTA
jgi:hypothetical protein